MEEYPGLSRRGFVRLGLSASAVASLAGTPLAKAGGPGGEGGGDPWRGLKMGLASYSFRKLTLEATVEGVRRVDLKYVSIKDAHLSLKSTAEQRKAVARKFRDAGITPLSCGVISLAGEEAEARNAFEYARDAGIPTIVCNPSRRALPLLEGLVKEFDIRIAIHNHGPEDKVWPSPDVVWQAVQSFDPRIGLCIDVGHTSRCGVDPSEAIQTCAGRLYDLHLKDIEGPKARSRPVEVGRGVLDIRKILETLLAIKYAYHVGLEHEKDADDPLPGVAESIGYVRGVLSTPRTS